MSHSDPNGTYVPAVILKWFVSLSTLGHAQAADGQRRQEIRDVDGGQSGRDRSPWRSHRHKRANRRHGRDEPLFRPQFLGGKYPAIDFFVELVGAAGNQTPFFLAQVKTTATGYTQAGCLRARMTPTEMINLVKYPAPTYVIGVDEKSELGFLVAALVGGPAQYRSLPTLHPLADLGTLQTLYEEVQAFWGVHGATFDHPALK